MATNRAKKSKAAPKADADLISRFDPQIKDFRGLMPTLEAAIGAYVVGRKIGWKPLYLIHEKRTIRKYEEILGIRFRDELPEVGEWAHKSIAHDFLEKIKNFWKAVSGEEKVVIDGEEVSPRDQHLREI